MEIRNICQVILLCVVCRMERVAVMRDIKEVPYRATSPKTGHQKPARYPEWTLKLSFSAVSASCNLSLVSYERAASALNPLLFHPLRDHPCAKFFGRTFLGCTRREVVKRGGINMKTPWDLWVLLWFSIQIDQILKKCLKVLISLAKTRPLFAS